MVISDETDPIASRKFIRKEIMISKSAGDKVNGSGNSK